MKPISMQLRFLRVGFLLVGCLSVLGSAVVQAEIYQYRDDNGVLRFTDNYLDVPPDQRPEFEPSEPAVQAQALTPQVEESTTAANSEAEPASGNSADATAAEASQGTVEVLKQEQTDLLAEYQALSAERDRLEALRESRETPEEIQQFNVDAEALSERIGSFNQRKEKLDSQLRGYVELIEGYNESVKAMTQPEARAPQPSSPQ
ncbi:MAG: DUF4124 domain-containing protein [Desulfobacterales bacterium]